MSSSGRIYRTRLAALLLCVIAAVSWAFPATAYARDSEKTVRVGWYESPYNRTDPYGRRSGYAYEFQQKIAAYTGWHYEYVQGSWSELLQMLIDGDIDLLGDISYTVGRSRSILYSMLPMGAEEYHIFTSTARNNGIDSGNYSSLNGKKIGVSKESVEADLLRSWTGKKGVQAEIVELTGSENESLELLKQGELDALVTIDGFGDEETIVPAFTIGSSDIYFAVSKARPELLRELDSAMLRIQTENSYYSQELLEKYFHSSGTNKLFTETELNWLSEHWGIGTIIWPSAHRTKTPAS